MPPQPFDDGDVSTGDRIRREEIAAELRVGRVPVREAVIALDREGWGMTGPHRGAFVAGRGENPARDHYGPRGCIHGSGSYGSGARRAAERAAAERAAAEGITTSARVYRRPRGTTDPEEFDRLDTIRFSTPSACGNAGLRAVMRAPDRRRGETASREFAGLPHRRAERVVALLTARGAVCDTAGWRPRSR